MRNLGYLLLGILVGIGVIVVGSVAAAQPAASARLISAVASSSAQAPAAPTLVSTPTVVPATPTAVAVAPPAATQAAPAPAAPTATEARPSPTAARPIASGSGKLLADEQALVDLYERVSPAVVAITNRRGVPGSGQFPSTGAGSGVVIDRQGHILTNNHVVDDATRLEVTLADGTNLPAKLLGRDPANDLAIVKIEYAADKLTVAPLGDSDALKPGQMAIAIGSPFGLERTITTGIISSTGRTRSNEGRRPIRNMIQTDAPINPGNSGGPLLNSNGEVIGINTAIESPVRGSVGIGFAVPINTARQVMPAMLAGQQVRHPWLGITGMPITPATAQELGIDVAEGVYVSELVPNGPAAKAGLKAGTARAQGEIPKGGDVILAIDGNRLNRIENISTYLDTRKVGDVVKLEILRDGAKRTINVTLEEWPEAPRPQAPRSAPPEFGVPEIPGFPRIPGLPIPSR